MKPYFLVPFSVLLSGCIINTGTLASGNASGNRANVNAQANTKVETKVDTSVSNQVNTHTNTNVSTTTNAGINTAVSANLPVPTAAPSVAPSVAPPIEDVTLVAWLDLELVPHKNTEVGMASKVEFKFAERPGMTKYKVVVKRLGDLPVYGGGLISNNGAGYRVSLVDEAWVPAGAPTSFEQEGSLPIFSWASPSSGEYAYQAIAYHKTGKTLTSSWIKFIVRAPATDNGDGTTTSGGNVIANGGGN